MEQPVRWGWRALAGLLASLILTAPAYSASNGISFIGVSSRTASSDMVPLGNALLNAGGPLQVSALPFEFNQNDPFANLSTLAKNVLPSLNGHLRITIYLRWYPHDDQGNRDQNAFWAAWGASSPNAAQRSIRSAFLGRVRSADNFVRDMRAWASQRGLQSKLGITFIPMLEDTCTSSFAYNTILNAIADQQRADGLSLTPYRRSCLPGNAFRVGPYPLELHGRWSEVRGRLQSGDAWSNDGVEPLYAIGDFVRDQKQALARNIDVLYWRPLYNGTPKERDNWERRTVNPFTGSTGSTERSQLKDALRGR